MFGFFRRDISLGRQSTVVDRNELEFEVDFCKKLNRSEKHLCDVNTQSAKVGFWEKKSISESKMKNQETVEDSRLDSHKRKWYYSEQNNAYANYADETNAKKCITTNGSGGEGGANYDYENYQPNHQLSPSNAVGQSTSLTMVNEMCKNPHELNGMELSENIEYVNILYDENLLSGVQAAQAADPNYINFEPNWNNADILDLDQRNYYYETTVVPNVIDMAEQQHHQPHHQQQHQGDQMCQLSQPVHHQEQYPETAMQSHSQPNMYIENSERREIAASAIAPLRKFDMDKYI